GPGTGVFRKVPGPVSIGAPADRLPGEGDDGWTLGRGGGDEVRVPGLPGRGAVGRADRGGTRRTEGRLLRLRRGTPPGRALRGRGGAPGGAERGDLAAPRRAGRGHRRAPRRVPGAARGRPVPRSPGPEPRDPADVGSPGGPRRGLRDPRGPRDGRGRAGR